MKASDKQVGGNHYKAFKIQPYEFFIKNDLSFHKADIIKRIIRYDLPGGKGLEDLKKIKHEIDLIIEFQDWEVQDFDRAWLEAITEDNKVLDNALADGVSQKDRGPAGQDSDQLSADLGAGTGEYVCPVCGATCYEDLFILNCNDYVICASCDLIYLKGENLDGQCSSDT